jgi:hypothetical protein
MRNFWIIALAGLFVALASFYAGRMSLDTTGKASAGKEELSPTSEKRSALRKPSDQSDSPRSAILHKPLTLRA